MTVSYLSKDGLIYLWSKIKSNFAAIGHRHDNATTSADGCLLQTRQS